MLGRAPLARPRPAGHPPAERRRVHGQPRGKGRSFTERTLHRDIAAHELAQTPREPLLAAARGVVWHGLAADALARAHGQTAVVTTQVLDFLGAALRESLDEQ